MIRGRVSGGREEVVAGRVLVSGLYERGRVGGLTGRHLVEFSDVAARSAGES